MFSDAVNGLRHQLGPNINENISLLDEKVNASYLLMSVASKLIADFCNRHFFGDVEVFDLYSQLRLIGN